MSNVLDLVDQVHFLGEQATGTSNVLQCVWVYNQEIDFEGVRRFHHHLQQGRLARRIEQSPVPFGRHRWVAPDRSCDLEIVGLGRPRAEFDAWLDEQASTPLDSEHGPEWHLAVLPFTDGGAGMSLVISHCLTDGVGLCEALAAAAEGIDDAMTWPAAQSRPRWRALVQDGRQAMHDVPGVGRALTAAARTLMHRPRHDDTHPYAPQGIPLPSGVDETASLATATVFVDAEHWYARAQGLKGTSNALLAALAARLAQRMGRVTADNSVIVAIPVNNRAPGDTRANAITGIDISVDPVLAERDLRQVRTAIKLALIHRQQAPDSRFALLPIVPLLPKWLVRRMIGVAVGSTTTASSNLGAISPSVNRPDGTDADYFAMKMRYPGMTKATMHRTAGLLSVLSGITHGQVFISAVAYHPTDATDELQQLISDVLSDFALTCTTEWPSAELAIAR